MRSRGGDARRSRMVMSREILLINPLTAIASTPHGAPCQPAGNGSPWNDDIPQMPNLTVNGSVLRIQKTTKTNRKHDRALGVQRSRRAQYTARRLRHAVSRVAAMSRSSDASRSVRHRNETRVATLIGAAEVKSGTHQSVQNQASRQRHSTQYVFGYRISDFGCGLAKPVVPGGALSPATTAGLL